MASIVRNVTFFLLLFLSLVTALPAGASSERNSILSGVKAESASCFVRGDIQITERQDRIRGFYLEVDLIK